jgi:putative colanic acid biosynthesis acetyltransferase WcaF
MKTAPTLADTKPMESMVKINYVQTTPFSLKTKLRIHLWRLIQKTLFRFSPVRFRGFRRWLLRVFGARISPTASIYNTARIECPWNLEMGDYASVGEDAWIYTLDKIVIGEYAVIGQRSLLLTGTHNFSDPTFPLITRPIVIGYGAWIAVGAIILPGVNIGALSVVGAGSVVTRDLPEQMICAGNPCKPIKYREFKEKTL